MEKLLKIKGIKPLFWVLTIVLTAVIFTSWWGERIPSTAQGIKVDTWEQNEEGQPIVEHVSGWTWYNPVRYEIIKYAGEYQECSGNFTFFTQEKLPVQVSVSTFVRPIRMQAGKIYQSYRVGPKELYSTLVNRLINDAVKKAGEGTPTDKLGSFTDLQLAINQQLDKSLPSEFLEQKNTVVTDIVLPQEIAVSVRAKIKAAEEIANQRQQTALQEETNKRTLMEAQGETAVRRERATATAMAIQKEASELTDLQIKKMWIDKWDGKLPTYVTGDQMQMLMQMKK